MGDDDFIDYDENDGAGCAECENERREEIARMFDPGAFSGFGDFTYTARQGRRDKAYAKADAILALPPLPQQGEWIKHDGSARSPVEGRNVEMRFRDGDTLEGFVMPGVDWSHADDDGDVMEYRVQDAAPPASQALAEPNIVGQTALAYMGEVEARDYLRNLIGSQSALAWATSKGLTGQQVDSFLRGDRPLEPKLATAMGLRRVCVYERMEKTDV